MLTPVCINSSALHAGFSTLGCHDFKDIPLIFFIQSEMVHVITDEMYIRE